MRIEKPETNSLEDIETLTTERTVDEIIPILEEFGREILGEYRDNPAMHADVKRLDTDKDFSIAFSGRICYGMRTPAWALQVHITDAGLHRVIEMVAVGQIGTYSEGLNWEIKDSIRKREQLREKLQPLTEPVWQKAFNPDVMDLNQGGYVFISHSHQDIQKVRQIRNAMEEAGFEPLCFYLKCLSDEDEIEGLIKREIDAREWFVYIDSPNSKASAWVAKERKYIESRGDKQIVTIDLETNQSMKEVSDKLIHGLRICIVCAEQDRKPGEDMQRRFMEKDMQASIKIISLPAAEPIHETQAGCIVPLLSHGGILSEQLDTLFSEETKASAKIIPVMIGGYGDSGSREILSGRYPALYRLEDPDNSSAKDRIVRQIETDVTQDFKKAFKAAKSHNEVWSYEMKHTDSPEAKRLAEEAHDRLDEEERMKDDIRNAIESGTMKMTDELRKFLES